MVIRHIRRGRAYMAGEGLGPMLVRNVAGSSAVQMASMVFTFLVGIQLARGLGVSGYGHYGIVMAVITIATIPSALGMPKLVTREVASADARGDAAAMLGVLRWADRTSGRIAMAIGLGILVGAAIAFAVGSTGLGLSLLVGAPMVALGPLGDIRAGALRGLHQVVLSQGSTVLFRPLALSILLFAVMLTGWKLNAPVAVTLNTLTSLGALLLTAHWLRRMLPKSGEPSEVGGREWLMSSIPMALSDAVQTLQYQFAILLLGVLVTTSDVGLLRVAITTAVIAAVPVTVINVVVLPMFAKLYQKGEREQLQRLVTHSARLQFAGVLLLSLPLLVAAGPLLGLVFGSGFARAAPALQILAVGQLIGAGFGPNLAVLNMTGQERRVTRGVSIAFVLLVPLVALLGSLWGSSGAAIGLLLGQIGRNAMLSWDAWKYLSIETSVLGYSRKDAA